MNYILCSIVLVLLVVVNSLARPEQLFNGIVKGDGYHKVHKRTERSTKAVVDEAEYTAEYWIQGAQQSLTEKLAIVPNTNKAKNVIMFLGDGMSVPTLTAARTYLGQKEGLVGENSKLSWENFAYTGLSKTYCVDGQVADSACTATAYLTGVKTNVGTLGVTAGVPYGDCQAMQNVTNHVYSILKWSQDAGKSTGIVTTTRVTHASPAGAYSHSAHRDWESDSNVSDDGEDPTLCRDIAYQLIHGETGPNFEVILGGGRREFLPISVTDEEGVKGKRSDGLNLIEDWRTRLEGEGKKAVYVWNRDELLNRPTDTEYLLGLFESSHMQYHLDANPVTEPTLSELVIAAIEQLSKNPEGFFLFVEGGRIDHAHHEVRAHKALDECVEMAAAVQAATDALDMEESLIVVTADHAHTMSMAGYQVRGNPIFGAAGVSDMDNLPYLTLSYANGLGYKPTNEDGTRYDLSQDNTEEKDYLFPGTVPLFSETHGGDDVAVYAAGAWSHLFTGNYEQNLIPHMMAYASCVGDGETMCAPKTQRKM